jgi:hypothetical protein
MDVKAINAYPNQGYILVQVPVGEIYQVRLISYIDGQVIATLPVPDSQYFEVIPSPNGETIAYVTSRTVDAPKTNNTVAFYTSQGQKIGSDISVQLRTLPIGTWTMKNEFILSVQDSAVSVQTNGTISPSIVPKCVSPQTTSTRINSKGQVIGTDNGKIGVVYTVGPDSIFGCL